MELLGSFNMEVVKVLVQLDWGSWEFDLFRRPLLGGHHMTLDLEKNLFNTTKVLKKKQSTRAFEESSSIF